MQRKRCQNCGAFLAKTDLLPEDDEFDFDLAIACGYSEEQISESWEGLHDDAIARFRYVTPVWECGKCDIEYTFDTDPERFYYDPDVNGYNAPRPLTPMEQLKEDLARQELAGQMRLPL